jgi:hypothetical protein
MTICVSRLVIFVGLATTAQKYSTRTILISESLCLFVGMQVGWIRETVCAAAAALYPTNHLPSYFAGFVRLTATPDEKILSEFNGFLMQKFSLKHFPFDQRKMRFVPLLVEAGSALQPLAPMVKGRVSVVASRASHPALKRPGRIIIRVPDIRKRASHV